MKDRFGKGFSILELVFVLAIITILIVIGTLNWQKQSREKEFRTQFDNLVQQVREAQAMARAHGRGYEGYNGSGTFANDQPGDYAVILSNHGADRTNKEITYKNVTVNFTNFQIKPMSETSFRDDFKGVALVFGFRSGSTYTGNKMLPFDSNGCPSTPTGESPPTGTNPEYIIEMSRKDGGGGYINRGIIYIDATTGAIRTEITGS